ncbi:histone acetyltransferase, GCN5-like [Babesia divergens]|uniref:Histone acetyltransferase, GCN5-like n=1 Tax=Babesia divergens TaxID=32595 RepID=A0AAD9G7C0_BABDI|nr:histone acetyltransferase, GCN5-like [Babesia divergens]
MDDASGHSSERSPEESSHTPKLPASPLATVDQSGVAWALRCAYADILRILTSIGNLSSFSSKTDECPIVEYSRTVKKPMDFNIMWQKVEDLVYLEDPSLFDEDIALIVKNMRAYNPPASLRYQASLVLERRYMSLRRDLVERIANILEDASKRGAQSAALSCDDAQGGVGYVDPTSGFRKRLKRRYPFSEAEQYKSYIRPPRNMHPIIYAVNQTMMGDSSAWEKVGTYLNSPGGLTRVLNAIEIMYARLLDTPYAKMAWFGKFVEPYNRILKEFEYRKFAADMRTSDSVDPNACALLMNRLRTGNYKDSILSFVGKHNMRTFNAMFPRLMDTLNDLHVNPHLVATPTQLRF